MYYVIDGTMRYDALHSPYNQAHGWPDDPHQPHSVGMWGQHKEEPMIINYTQNPFISEALTSFSVIGVVSTIKNLVSHPMPVC